VTKANRFDFYFSLAIVAIILAVEIVAILPAISAALSPTTSSRIASRYSEANAALGSADVVFVGDSITDFWTKNGGFFPGQDYTNRGIANETTGKVLARFRQDVIELHPKTVVILAGINDLAVKSSTTESVTSNLRAMSELARAHGIRVVLASLLPLGHGLDSGSRFVHADLIPAINAWSRSYCAQTGCSYLDYSSAMSTSNGTMFADLTDDGLHPNAKGYAVMAPIAESTLGR
jgi:lysophospholipase L1-like esterase